MPLYFDVLISFVVGIVWCRRLSARPDFFAARLSWPLVAGLVFQCVVLMPLQAFAFRFHHDWSTAYLIDPDRHPHFDGWLGLWALLAALGLVGCAVAGHFVGRITYDKPRSKTPRWALSVTAALAVILGAVFFREFLYVGTYEEFAADSARLFVLTSVGLVFALEAVACAVFLIYAPRLLSRIPSESAQLH